MRTLCLAVPVALTLLAVAGSDAPRRPALSVQPTVQTVEEGEYAVVDASLTTPPDTNVTVRIFRSSTKLSAPKPLKLRFTPENWNTPQAVRWKAVSDEDGDDEEVALVFHLATDRDALARATVRVKDDDASDRPIRLCGARLWLLEAHRAGEELDVCWQPGSRIRSSRNVVIEARRKSYWNDPIESFSPWREVSSGDWYKRCGQGDSCVRFTAGGLWRGFAKTFQMRLRRGRDVLAVSPELQVQAPNSDSASLNAELSVVRWRSSDWGPATGRFAMELEFTDPLVGGLTTELVRDLEASDFEVTNGVVAEAVYWRGGAYRVVVEPQVQGEPVRVRLPGYTVKGVGEGLSASGGNNYTRYNSASNLIVQETSAPD